MNYRHAYHAGNFADVLKHSVLVGLIEALKQKQTPFCYIDTHAGRGQYDLHGEEARKTREFADGVLRLLDAA
ncbi:MAG TPA: 23S rRNA (adenine(2030)-N(6))-methyltransferase RlmJ, partial [Tahibacter sp.]|nr:23S rRNA (adenine(2030)-N(6))-methyltransferase RlmJ [Tahibacter sp.]